MSDKPEALRLADAIDPFVRSAAPDHHDVARDAAAELRRLHAELERKSDAIQRLWKERDELRTENRTLVRQNGEWQEHNAELVGALKGMVDLYDTDDGCKTLPQCVVARAALAKVEASK